MAKKWTTDDIPNQKDRVIIITGATSGLGKEAARVFGEKQATVILAVRNTQKAEDVVTEFKSENPIGIFHVRELDLSSLASVKSFSESILKEYKRLDVLINNAGE